MNLNSVGGEPQPQFRLIENTKGRRSLILERSTFQSYRVTEEKSIDDHLRVLKKLASVCEFGDQAELLIRDKILAGYNDTSILEKLRQEENVTLTRVLELIKAKEKIKIFCPMKPSTSFSDVESFGNVEDSCAAQYKIVSKEKVDSVINSSLKNCLTLNVVEAILETSLNCVLSQDDKSYIQSKYLERLVELWLDEVSENVMDMFDNSTPLQFIDELNNIKDLQGCLKLGLNTPYNRLLNDLSKDEICTISQEKKYILEFKFTTVTFMRLKTAYLQGEINFHQSFIRTLKLSKDVPQLCNSLKTNILMESVEDETMYFKKFLQEIINCSTVKEPLTQLKAAAKVIIAQECYFFVKCVKKTIKDYLTPFVVTESFKDGRKLLEIIGDHIVVSEVLPKISRSNFHEIEEVRFVQAGVLHIDEHLNPTLWHGKNIVVHVETVIVSKEEKIIWDVSGRDAEIEESDQAGTDIDGVGLNGSEGKSGESGGNVLFICHEIENALNLKIVVNGGNGSRGQDGGKGCSGKNGAYITNFDFIEKFPPGSKYKNSRKQDSLEKTRSSVMANIESVKFFVLGSLISLPKDEFNDILKKYIQDLNDMYFEVKTQSGCSILFSFYYGPIFTFCQSFLLHKGADGEPGKEGGKGGLAGKGGCPGDVKIQVASELAVQDIVICANKGQDGKPGVPGVPGNPGKSGQDCAYIDSTKMMKPKLFISQPHDHHRLTVKYHQEKGPDRVYCFHNAYYAEIAKVEKSFFQSFKMIGIPNKNAVEESQLEGSQIIRKKTIDTKCILEQYDRKTSIANSQKLDNLEQKIKHIYEHITNEEELQKQTVKESKITRKIEFPHNQYEVYLKPISLTSHQEISRDLSLKDQFIDFAKNSPTDVRVWKTITQIHLSLEELRTLWNTVNIQSFFSPSEFILISKYRLAVFEFLQQSCIEKHTSFVDRRNSKNSKLVGSVQNCLIQSQGNDQMPCNEIERYLCDDSEEQRMTFINNLKLRPCDKYLLLEIYYLFFDEGCSILNETKMAMYKEDLYRLKQEKANNMNNKILPILNDLKKDKSHQMYDKLVGAVNNQNIHAKLDIEQYIHNDELLPILFEIYKKEVKGSLVWKSQVLTHEHLTSDLEEIFIDDIKCKGAVSVFYRELLARYFDTNILLYTVNDSNQMVLIYNHNPSANATIRMLMKNKKLFKLKVDERWNKMNNIHDEKSQKCKQIQLYLESITDKNQFDKFLTDSPFLNNGYNTVSKSVEIQLKINQMLMEDENIQLISNCFDQDEDKTLISSRLKMLKHEYVGYQSVLHYVAQHMKFEGNHLKVSELCCVINFILKLLLESPSKMQLVSWVIAANHQTNWLSELTLLKLELNFKQLLEQDVKSIWKNYLNKTNKETLMLFLEKLDKDQSLVDLESVEEVLFLLSHIPYNHAGLPHLYLAEWKYLLKDLFWICQVKSMGCWCEEQLRIASFYLVTLENLVGFDLCNRFLEVVKNRLSHEETEDWKEKILTTLKLLTCKETLFNENLLNILSNHEINKWEEVIKIESFFVKETRSLKQLHQLMKNSSNTSEGILTRIDETVSCVGKICPLISFLISKMKDVLALKKWISGLLDLFTSSKLTLFSGEMTEETTIDIQDKTFKNFLQEMRQNIHKETKKQIDIEMSDGDNHVLEEESQSESDFLISNLNNIFLATVCASIYFVFDKITLRDTQLLAILTFLKASGNVLGQISTGEGKSFIIISVAIIKALSGSKVDIITSSHVLAKRDAKAYKYICNLFGIEVGHNCSENIEERKRTYSNCQIVYGELAYYQRDYLLDRVYNDNVLGDRTFETVLVDEVDSMLLDKGNNVLYLSHEIPGLDKLEPLIVYIWKCLNLPYRPNNHEELISVDKFRNTILCEMYDQIKVEDIRNLDTSLEEKHILQTWAHLVEGGVIDSTGKILQSNKSKLDEVAKQCVHECHIKYLFDKIFNRKKAFEIPNYLKPFVEDHLEEWIESAINAMNLKVNIDYVVDVDRSVDSADRDPNIIIVDRDTGTDMTNSQWGQGLHQFLQLKHGCRISPLSFKAVFISNVHYLKQYNTLYGLTGTLGSERERHLLEEEYKVELVTIPTAKAKDFTEEIPLLCNSSAMWSSKIFEEVYNVTATRSALIICESVNDVLFLSKHFDMSLKTKSSMRKVFPYTRDYEKFSIAEHLDPGHIIISTNLAGRGTDIKLSRKLVNAGGLHVCLSFLPSNCRIEEQAFGRAARNGEPGSGQLIFRNFGSNNFSKIIDVKRKRDEDEVFRISGVKKYYETKIKPEEDWFSKFQQTYSALRDSTKYCNKIKSVLLMTCLNQWAIWLDRKSNSRVNETPEDVVCSKDNESVHSLINSVSKLMDDNFNIWSSQIQDPFQLTKLGLLYLKQSDIQTAIQLFDRVITDEPVYSEAAYYYRVCARSSLEDMKSINLVKELEIVENKLKERIVCSLVSARFIDLLKTSNKNNILQINSFEEQQRTISQTYEVFIGSIQNIIGHPVTPESFLAIGSKPLHGISEEKVSHIIFRDLIKHEIVKQRIKSNVSENDLKFLSEYGMCPKKMKDILECFKDTTGLKLEENIMKWFRECSDLPSRELLWNELVSAGVLRNEVKLVLINQQSLSEFHPSLAKKIQKLSGDINTPLKDQLSLYSPEELGQIEERFVHCYSSFCETTLEKKVGLNMLEFLKGENLIKLNRLATLSNPLGDVELNYFDSISQDDFMKVGIPADTAACIIKDLVNQQIISVKEKGDRLQYSLSINYDDIGQIDLETYKAYLDDVKQMLSHCFAFRIALQKLVHVLPSCKGNYRGLFLPLQINLDKRLWNELQTFGIVERITNHEKIKSEQLQDVYFKSANKEEYIKIFSKVYDMVKSKDIVDELIKNQWLKGKRNFNINCEIKQNQIKLVKPTNLSPTLKADIETIELILSNCLYLSHNVKFIEDRLKHLEGGIHNVLTASLSLTSLETVLNQYMVPTSEINTFTLNGFDEVVYLEEKKYTTRMKIYVFCMAMFGVIEVAVGAFLEVLGNPLGLCFLKEGLNDIIFVTECVFTGYFSWKNYFLSKLTSLINTSATCLKAFANITKSNFATKTAGISFTTFKEKCCNPSNFATETTAISFSSFKEQFSHLFSKAKSTVGRIFSSEVTKTVSRREIITHVCKRVVVHTAQGMACGATFAYIDHLVETKVNDLGELLTDIINSDIDDTVIKHPVISSAVELCNQLGKRKSQNVVEKSLLKVSSRYQVKLDKSFDSIDLKVIKALIERTTSKGFTKKSDNESVLLHIAIVATNVCAVIKSGWSHLQVISSFVSEILNEIHQELQTEINKPRKVQNSWTINDSDLEYFKCDILSILQSSIKSDLSEHIKKKVLLPILEFAGSCFIKHSFQTIGKVSKSFLTEEEIYQFTQSKRPNFLQKSKTESDKNTELFYSDFNRISLELLKTRKNKSVMVQKMLMSQNAPLDMYCLELCFKLIPFALKLEGIKVPYLRVEMEENGTKRIFELGDATGQGPVVYISRDADFTANLKNNKLLVKDVIDFLSKSFLEKYPENKGLTATALQQIFLRVIDRFCDSHSSDTEASCTEEWLWNSPPFQGSKLNTKAENMTPYQHSHYCGGWKFSPHVDVDLREKDEIINFSRFQCHIARGFETALRKINNHIHIIQKRLRSFDLVIDDFSATKHLLAPPPLDDTSEIFFCFTVQYELVVPVMLIDCDRLVDFAIILRLENEKPTSKPQPNSPNGPHIFYEINPVSDVKFINKGLRGHILLNIDCINTSYSINDCHGAGELIVPTAISKQNHLGTGSILASRMKGDQKERKFIIIADSLFRDIRKHVTLPKNNCDFEMMPNKTKKLRWIITSYLNNYQGVKCIALFFGKNIIKTNVAEHKLVSCIFEVIEEIQKQMKNVKVILYSLTYVKDPAMKHFWKIFNINRTLNKHCLNRNITLVSTNEVISPQDLGKDGIHLKKSGYQKLGKHLSEKCKEIVNLI